MPKHRITYQGADVVQIDGVGKFIDGTTAYVDEAQARFAKTIAGFIVEGLPLDPLPEPRKRVKLESEPASELAPVAVLDLVKLP